MQAIFSFFQFLSLIFSWYLNILFFLHLSIHFFFKLFNLFIQTYYLFYNTSLPHYILWLQFKGKTNLKMTPGIRLHDPVENMEG